MDRCQNNLSVISLKWGEFKFSIGGLNNNNNNIPYTVQNLSTILQLA